MPSSLVLGNGSLLINFDGHLNMKDIYFPQVGLTNHLGGRRNQFAVWSDSHYSLVGGHDWELNFSYLKETLASQATATNHKMEIGLNISDAVHYRENIYIRKITVHNHRDTPRQIRIFWTENMAAGGSKQGNAVFYLQDIRAVNHYKGAFYFLFSGTAGGVGINHFTCGATADDRFACTAGDAEDGNLEGRPVADGVVDSTIGLNLDLPADGEATAYFWMVAGSSLAEVRRGQQLVSDHGPDKLIEEATVFWLEWCRRQEPEMADLSSEVDSLYKRSLLIIRTQIDNGGAILAGNDSEIYEVNPDAYCYLWPRDGALVANCLDRAGYFDLTSSFYRLSARIISPEGFFLQRYDPVGRPGSTWHPWWKEGKSQLPIQEDETSLVLWALWEHYRLGRNLELVKEVYRDLVLSASRFISSYLDLRTGLPLPSYDLWEERRGIFAFTTAAVVAGLRAAASFANLFGDRDTAAEYSQQADRMKEAVAEHLYDEGLGRFLRGCYVGSGGELHPDYTLDSSMYGIFAFGVFPADDPRVIRTMEAIRDGLWVKTAVGGLARYPNDYYFQSCFDTNTVPGNPWIITTLWLADWYTARAASIKELGRARELIEWAAEKASPAGIFSEQVHPETGELISVAPLTWSHATFVSSVLNYVERHRQFTAMV